MASSDKSAAGFAQTIAENIVKSLKTENESFKDSITFEITKLVVHINTLLTKVEDLSAKVDNLADAGSTVKRVVRTGAAKTAAATPAPSKKAAASSTQPSSNSKVKNTMLWVRKMWAEDENFQIEFGSPESAEALNRDSSVEKARTAAANSKEPGMQLKALQAEGLCMWKTVLNGNQKNTIRERYKLWNKENNGDAVTNSPLTYDNGGYDDTYDSTAYADI